MLHHRRGPVAVDVAGAVAVACFVIGSVWLSRSSGPVLWDDEGTYLYSASEFARLHRPILLANSPTYSAGYSLLLAPGVALFGAARTFEIALLLNVMAAIGVFFASARMARELLPDRQIAHVLIPLVAATYPSLLMQSTRAWPEAILTMLVSLWSLSALRYATTGDRKHLIFMWTAAAAGFIVHHRLVSLLLVTLVAPLIISAIPKRRRVATTVLGLVPLVFALTAASRIDRLASTDAYQRSRRMTLWLIRDEFVNVAASFGGQLWALVIGTTGIAAGVLVLDRELRRNRGLWIAGLGLIGSLGVTTLFLARNVAVDHVLYSRYIDIFGPVALVVGLVSILRAKDHFAHAIAIPLTVTASLALAAWKLETFAGAIVKIRVTSLLPWDLIAGNRNQPTTPEIDAWEISLVVVAVCLVLVAILRRSSGFGLGALLVVNLAAAAAGSAWSLEPWLNITETAGIDILGHLEERGETELLVVAYPSRTTALPTARAVAYQSDYTIEIRDYGSTDCPDALFAIGTSDPPPYPAEVVAISKVFKSTLWMKTC